jgi:hypothetical protein
MTDEPYEDELYEEIGMILNRHKLVSATRDDIKEFIESHYYFGITPPLEPFKLKGLEPLSKKLNGYILPDSVKN